MSEELKRIEEEHRIGSDTYCLGCGQDLPCDVVKLARALDLVRPYIPETFRAEVDRALREVGGEE